MSLLTALGTWLLPFLVVLTVLVFVHELGHYWVARRCGVRVETFSIGFGPELFGWTDRAGTRWKFSLVPLGGYVKMFGEADFEDDEEEKPALSAAERAVSFAEKPVGKRAAIVAAGPIANFLFALLLFIGIFTAAGLPAPLAGIGDVQAGSAAETAGLRGGDLIVAIDEQPVRWFEDVRKIVSAHPGQALSFRVVRGEEDLTLTATPRPAEVAGEGRVVGLLGIRPDPKRIGYEPTSFVQAIGAGVERTIGLSLQILASVWQVITGDRSTDELGGPLRIAQISGQMAQDGVVNLLFFMAALSVNLGLINLFPIPMLDGGHLVFYLAEAIRGRPLDKRIMEYGFRMGIALVLMLMIFATWNDLVHLKVFEFFRQLVS